MNATSAWEALTKDPRRFLLSAWPWRAFAYLFTSAIVAYAWWAATLILLFVPAAGLVVLLSGVALGTIERRRLRLVDAIPATSQHTKLDTPGLWTWLTIRLREKATWQELGYALLFGTILAWADFAVSALLFCALYLVAFPVLLELWPQYQPDWPQPLAACAIGLLALPVVLYLITAYAGLRAALTRFLLGSGTDPELTRSRARLVEAFDAQRRRIERDLHDGAQQRLTALILTLGLAKYEIEPDTPAKPLVDKAYDEAKATLAEIRDLVRGIYPPVLTDRGLAPALAELADRCPVKVELEVDLPSRPPEATEAALWFVAGEALANVAKHSNATRARLSVRRETAHLVLEVHDDGQGGADPAKGTGLQGLADRVAVLDGRLTLTSPPGGPTEVRVEVPCA